MMFCVVFFLAVKMVLFVLFFFYRNFWRGENEIEMKKRKKKYLATLRRLKLNLERGENNS